MDPCLEFEGVTRDFGEVRAVDGVSFAVNKGDVFGLLGPNGAGKTTLMRMAADLIRPDRGEVRLFGHSIRRELLDRLGYLPEERGLYRRARVVDLLIYFAELKGLKARVARERAHTWLERLELSGVGRWRFERLSKGMGQKIQIAAVLISDPDLCVLDEPFTGLDPISVQLIQDVIRERAKRGQTTILSTHQMGFVETLCNRVALVHRGRLRIYGTVEAVRAEHSKPEVLVRLDGPLPALPDGILARSNGPTSWILTLHNSIRPHELAQSLVAAGAHLLHFEIMLASLEEVFIRNVERGGVA